MPATSFYRLVSALAITAGLGLGLPAAAQQSAVQIPAGQLRPATAGSGRTMIFQPLNNPASKERHPGKFVWADLFTTDPAAATIFYRELFGWTATTLNQDGKAYTVFSNGNRPVAGLAPRPPSNIKRPSRWVGYIAVANIESTLALVEKAGGQVRAPARAFPKRGSQAIIADNEGSTIGLLQSSSGDSADDEPNPGDWNWFELFVRNPQVVTAFYRHVFAYAVKPDNRTERKNDYLLSNDGRDRAGVAPLPDRDDAKPGWICIVRVANLNETLVRVPALGGEILLPPRPAAHETRFAIIADSTGGAIGLVEYVDNDNPATRP